MQLLDQEQNELSLSGDSAQQHRFAGDHEVAAAEWHLLPDITGTVGGSYGAPGATSVSWSVGGRRLAACW
jgi:hypothetical protein